MELAVILARAAQYLAAATLFGTPLFLIYAFPPTGSAKGAAWARSLGVAAGVTLLVASIIYLCAQTAVMANDPAAASDPGTLAGVLTDSPMGFAVIARAAAAIAALISAAVLKPGRLLWLLLAAFGALAQLSFAWTGHGAATEAPGGWLHLIADLLHLLAAGAWIGALLALSMLLAKPGPATSGLHGALAGFSGIGSVLVALILATGLVNSWFLVGPGRWAGLFNTAYGLLLLAKIAAFGAMVLLAACNRFSHTPALGRAIAGGQPELTLRRLRASVVLEASLGVAVLALVAVLGMLEPIAAR